MAEENDVSVGSEEKPKESKTEKTEENQTEKTGENKSDEGKPEVDPQSEEKNELPKNGDLQLLGKQIVRQVEYYFGDINLPRDRFLQEQIKLDDGWVPLKTMLNFQRLASLTKDTDIIADALKKSSLIEINDDRSKIRRSPDQPLPVWNEERRKELMTRTLYLKGFPVQDSTLDKLLDFFAQHSTVENVQMRTYKDKATNKFIFKGSVFVTFPSKEKAEEFLSKEIKYDGNDLIMKWQSVYVEEKRKEREEAKAKRKGAQNEAEKKALPKGAILHLKGLTSDISREQIKDKLTEYEADVAYISYDKGDEEGWIRLQGENSTKAVLEKIGETTLEIGNVKIEIRALEGEEEEQFLKKTMEDIQKRRHHNNQNKRGGRRGGGRGGFRGDRKRKGAPADSDDGPPTKVAAKSE